jgi:hypothetical protein
VILPSYTTDVAVLVVLEALIPLNPMLRRIKAACRYSNHLGPGADPTCCSPPLLVLELRRVSINMNANHTYNRRKKYTAKTTIRLDVLYDFNNVSAVLDTPKTKP